MALPNLKPGKSLRFAMLPEGQDPDDLARVGGRGAIEDVIAAARPLADIVWTREVEGGSFATPERRAALEARINELAQDIRDEVVRRYYREELRSRLQRMFAPEPRQNWQNRRPANFQGRMQGTGPGRPGASRFAPKAGGRGGAALAVASHTIPSGPYQVVSPFFASSPLMPGQRSALSRREALILKALLNHPFLLHDHLEDVAALELANPEAHRLRAGIIAAFAHDHHHGADETKESAKLHSDLEKAGYTELLQRVGAATTTRDVWGVEPEAARDDVLSTWKQLVALHRQRHSLLRELKDAELALGSDGIEANAAWLNDVQARLADVDGTEALIEGFGESSGRFQRGD